MATIETRYEHIALDEKKVPIIVGTNIKLVELILDHIAYGWSPEELRFQHPHLSLGQIHSALAYYWDHQEALDEDIEQRLRLIDKAKHAQKPTPLKIRLRNKGLV